jgi:hypothetical protein
VQNKNVPLPIEVTLSGIEILFRLKHPENAQFPIEVILLGIVMLLRDLHPLKASLGIVIIGLLNVITPNPFSNSCDSIFAPNPSMFFNSILTSEEYRIWQFSLLQLATNIAASKMINMRFIELIV